MKREDARRENARFLANQNGGLAEFARRLEMSNSQVSQIIGKTPTKNIGNSIAPRIEDAYGVERGWLDQDRPQSQHELTEESMPPAETAKSAARLILAFPKEVALLEKYRMSNEPGKALIDTVADQTTKLSIDDVLRNQEQSGT
jgi:transcriptional regulator with XRE-family HTH domain